MRPHTQRGKALQGQAAPGKRGSIPFLLLDMRAAMENNLRHLIIKALAQ